MRNEKKTHFFVYIEYSNGNGTRYFANFGEFNIKLLYGKLIIMWN